MKANFTFDLDNIDDKELMELMLKSQDMKIALEDIFEQIIRPAFKHGYSKEIEDLISLCPEIDTSLGKVNVFYEIMDLLRERYHDIMKEI